MLLVVVVAGVGGVVALLHSSQCDDEEMRLNVNVTDADQPQVSAIVIDFRCDAEVAVCDLVQRGGYAVNCQVR